MKDVHGYTVVGWSILLLVCLLWTYPLLSENNPWIPLDYTNFVIHEMGHLLLFWAAEFVVIIGGSLFQLLVPFLIGGYFLVRRSLYAVGFFVFWLGDSMINLAAYIADARAQVLPIVGGRHDWNWILGQLGQLHNDLAIAGVVYFLGRLSVLIGLAVMIWMIVYAWREIRRYRTIKYPQQD
jgi:hypothetical protein